MVLNVCSKANNRIATFLLFFSEHPHHNNCYNHYHIFLHFLFVGALSHFYRLLHYGANKFSYISIIIITFIIINFARKNSISLQIKVHQQGI